MADNNEYSKDVIVMCLPNEMMKLKVRLDNVSLQLTEQ